MAPGTEALRRRGPDLGEGAFERGSESISGLKPQSVASIRKNTSWDKYTHEGYTDSFPLSIVFKDSSRQLESSLRVDLVIAAVFAWSTHRGG